MNKEKTFKIEFPKGTNPVCPAKGNSFIELNWKNLLKLNNTLTKVYNDVQTAKYKKISDEKYKDL